MLKTAFFVSLTCAVLSIGGCSSDPATATPPAATNTPPPGTAPTTTKKANKVSGSIKDERGNAITVPGVSFVVNANGLTASGEVQGVTPQVKPDGTYEADLVALGQYKVNAQIKVPWNGATYLLPLAPVQDNTISQLSSDGVVQDFVWKLSGPKTGQGAPVNADKFNAYHWYGAGISLIKATYREDLMTGVPAPDVGTKWELTLTPKQPKLIDGSDAKEVKIERTWDGFNTSNTLTDIPLCVYDLSGVEIGAGGERKPLVFAAVTNTYTPTFPVTFPLDASMNGDPFYPQITFDLKRP